MTTECNQFVFGFHPQKRREIRAQFDGGAITSDGGGLLLREVEKRVSGELLFGPRFLIPTQCNNVTFSPPAWRGLCFIFLNVARFQRHWRRIGFSVGTGRWCNPAGLLTRGPSERRFSAFGLDSISKF